MAQSKITREKQQKRNKQIIDYWEANRSSLNDSEIRLNLFAKGLGTHMTTFRVIAKHKAEKYQIDNKAKNNSL